VSIIDNSPIVDNIPAGTTVRWQLFVFDSVNNPITLDKDHQEKGFNNFKAKFEHES
jgi:hypothetical protein